jgi:transposase
MIWPILTSEDTVTCNRVGGKETMKRRKYSQEFKAEAIKMILELGLVQEDVAKRLAIPSGTLGNWITRYQRSDHTKAAGDQTMAGLQAENARLRKELAEVRMEREILKKATAYFAKESVLGTHS